MTSPDLMLTVGPTSWIPKMDPILLYYGIWAGANNKRVWWVCNDGYINMATRGHDNHGGSLGMARAQWDLNGFGRYLFFIFFKVSFYFNKHKIQESGLPSWRNGAYILHHKACRPGNKQNQLCRRSKYHLKIIGRQSHRGTIHSLELSTKLEILK